MPGPFKSMGAHGRGSKMRIKPKHWVYSIMERLRIIYKIIKIIQYIVMIILLFYLYCIEIQQLICNITS